MSLERLIIRDLRNLEKVDVSLSSQVNLFYGDNGSGKTSILEAIHVLASGRSFRTRKYKTLVKLGQSSFTIFGSLKGDHLSLPIGVTRSKDGDARFKVGGQAVSSAAELAVYLPTQVINSETFLLLDGSPKVRREFIDWLVFHVEQSFFSTWKEAQRCLQHRNNLLRVNAREEDFLPWDRELARLTERIHLLRDKVLSHLQQVFENLCGEFLQIGDIKLVYFQGWNSSKSYAQVLKESFESDQRVRYTQSGSHRADLILRVGEHAAAEVLSRGQQKLLVCALKIAQGLAFSEMTNRSPIFLIDDLPAELDEKYRRLLIEWLKNMKAQVFVTGIDKGMLCSGWDASSLSKVFHVKHGQVTEDISSQGSAINIEA